MRFRLRSLPVTWYPSAMLDAQLSHMGWGAFVMLVSYVQFGCSCVGILFLVGFIILKEFVFDIIVEKDTWVLSAFDMGMYVVGALLGWLAWVI